jgi:hypothetical protein
MGADPVVRLTSQGRRTDAASWYMPRLDRPYRTRQIGNRQAVIGEITGKG